MEREWEKEGERAIKNQIEWKIEIEIEKDGERYRDDKR